MGYLTLSDLVTVASIVIPIYGLCNAVYNVYFHPLAKFPGPLLWKAFRFPFVYQMWRGHLPIRVRELHEKYGSTVRIAPNELSYTNQDAWKDIYSRREISRPPQWGGPLPGLDAHTLISAPGDVHARLRKALAGGFSENAARRQEPLISGHIDKLVLRLQEEIAGSTSAVVKLAEWINFTTFDIMGDFGWSNSFKCLDSGKYHPWVLVVLWYKGLLFGVTLQLYPILNRIVSAITPKSAQDGVRFVVNTSRTNVTRRYDNPVDKGDMMSYVLAYNEKNPDEAISLDETIANSSTIIVAGSDPLASVLAGAITYLVRDPKRLSLLEEEVRNSFRKASDITVDSVKQLQYLHATLMEAMRLCPPVPDNIRRQVSRNGLMIAGEFVPPGTTVGITPYAAFRSSAMFEAPDEFQPERWLNDSNSTKFYPFGFGPRSCAGQALAWVEMRLILTRLLWSFNIRQPGDAEVPRWTSQKIFWTWQRDALPVLISRSDRPAV